MTTQITALETINEQELQAAAGGGTRQTSQSTVQWSPKMDGGGSISIGGGAQAMPAMPAWPEMPPIPGF